MLNGKYPVPVEERGIAASDCAAEVVEIGAEVKGFKVGDRVAPIFDTNNLTGLEDERFTGLGGDEAGVLREYAVFDERVLVRLPGHLSWEEVGRFFCFKMVMRLIRTQGFHSGMCWRHRMERPQLSRVAQDRSLRPSAG